MVHIKKKKVFKNSWPHTIAVREWAGQVAEFSRNNFTKMSSDWQRSDDGTSVMRSQCQQW